MTETARTVMSLSSGTLAKLFGTDNYQRIDAKLAEWVLWLRGREFETWQDAWAAYQEACK